MGFATGGKMKTGRDLVQAAVLFLAMFVSGVAGRKRAMGHWSGPVFDPTGAVVTKAAVSAISPQYGQPHETYTDTVGTYRLESLQPGIYGVTLRRRVLKPLTVTGVVINGSLTTTINGKLKLAAAQQTIEVQAPAAQVIDTQSGQLGRNHQPPGSRPIAVP